MQEATTTTAVANVNVASLNRAVEESSGGSASPMTKLHTVKIYNPEPGKPADPVKDGKFVIKLADNKGEALVEGPLCFSPLSITAFYSGSLYPIDPVTMQRSDDKVFFYTNEFSRFAKKTDTIGLASKGKAIGFFEKGLFEQMIKAPRLNGTINQFYETKKDSKGKPYDSSALARKFMMYGVFTHGDFAGECFRMVINPSHFGITFKDGAQVDAEEGTFESVLAQALPDMNALLEANNLRTVRGVEPDQIDMAISIIQNEKKNNLPYFSFEGLVAARNGDNFESREYVRSIQREQFEQVFVALDVPTKIQIEAGEAKVFLQLPTQEPKQKAIAAATGEDAEGVFSDDDDYETTADAKSGKTLAPPF